MEKAVKMYADMNAENLSIVKVTLLQMIGKFHAAILISVTSDT